MLGAKTFAIDRLSVLHYRPRTSVESKAESPELPRSCTLAEFSHLKNANRLKRCSSLPIRPRSTVTHRAPPHERNDLGDRQLFAANIGDAPLHLRKRL